jgi:hypothetical protein
MIRCTNCGNVITEIKYRGPVLIAEGLLTVDETGKIVSCGPAKALQTIKAGEEYGKPDMQYMCTACKAVGSMDLFRISRTCVLSGGEATISFRSPFGEIYINEAQRDVAERVFSAQNAVWESPL